MYTVSQKMGHFYFYCNFVKYWPILIILLLSEPEIIFAVIKFNCCYLLSSCVLQYDVIRIYLFRSVNNGN